MTPSYWARATRELAAADGVMAQLIERHDAFVVGSRGDAFSTLARAIVGQQLSVKAAQSVWTRLRAEIGGMSARALLLAPGERLRACGLSGAKVIYLRDLAERFDTGVLDVEAWATLDDAAVIDALTQLKGIGRWTAEMFLIFYLARPDVFPLADVGLQRAMRLTYNRGRALSASRIRRLGTSWSPWRSVATWYLWRSLDPIRVQY